MDIDSNNPKTINHVGAGMLGKSTHIRNPLTIIGIFAGVAEIGGNTVLPFLAECNQRTYMWFLILFPAALVAVFFFTLWKKHYVLYGPSDYKDDEGFLKTASPELAKKRFAQEIYDEIDEKIDAANIGQKEEKAVKSNQIADHSFERYFMAKELVLNKISQYMRQSFEYNVQFVHGPEYIFDGVLESEFRILAIQVKYLENIKDFDKKLARIKTEFNEVYSQLPAQVKRRFSLILAIATDRPASIDIGRDNNLPIVLQMEPFTVEVRLFDLETLKNELKETSIKKFNN